MSYLADIDIIRNNGNQDTVKLKIEDFEKLKSERKQIDFIKAKTKE